MSHNNIVSYLETGVAIYLLLFIYIYTIQSILLQQFFFFVWILCKIFQNITNSYSSLSSVAIFSLKVKEIFVYYLIFAANVKCLDAISIQKCLRLISMLPPC